MTTSHALTRDGLEPNRAGRVGVSEAMVRLLDEGASFTDPEIDLDPEDLRSWSRRLTQLARDLADCVEAPARNRVMEVLSIPSVPDDGNALEVLRMNVAGASYAQLGTEVGVAGRTVERIEDWSDCQVAVAKKIADRFALNVSELFEHRDRGDGLRCRTVGGLREALLKRDRQTATVL